MLQIIGRMNEVVKILEESGKYKIIIWGDTRMNIRKRWS